MAKLVFKLFSVCAVAATLCGAERVPVQAEREKKEDRALGPASEYIISLLARDPGATYALMQQQKAEILYLQHLADAYPGNKFPEERIKSFAEMNMTRVEYDSYVKGVKEDNEFVRKTNRVLETWKTYESSFEEYLRRAAP